MDNNQAIPTDQQMSLIESLVKSGVLSPDAIQSHAAQYSDANSSGSSQPAPQGANIDVNTLQSLIKHAVNPNAVPMQEGDNMHPMDAMEQIWQQQLKNDNATATSPSDQAQNGPAAPSGIEHTGGRQVIQNAPISGLIPQLEGRVTPGLSTQSAMPGIPGLLGMKKNTPVGPNLYAAAKQAGVDKFLGEGLPQMPDGTPFVSPASFKEALEAQKTVFGQGNQSYTSKDQLLAQGLPEDVANSLMAANPNGVTNKEITNYLGGKRLQSAQQMADARTTMAQVADMKQKLEVGGFESVKPTITRAAQALGAVQRAQAIIDQIVENKGMAVQNQRADLAAALSQVASSSNGGVVTDEKMNKFMPQSAMAKYGNYKAYWTNENQPIDFSGFLPQMQDLLTREKNMNSQIFQEGLKMGTNIYATQRPKTANTLSNLAATNPLVGTPPRATGAWKVVR